MGWLNITASGKDDDDFKQNLRKKVAEKHGVDADEIVLNDDGTMVLDRRAKFPLAKPMKVGDWRKWS